MTNWRKHLTDIRAWLEPEAITQREMLLLDYLTALTKYRGNSWRIEVTAMRDRLALNLEDRSDIETWVMNKLWLLAQAGAENSGVTEKDIWKGE